MTRQWRNIYITFLCFDLSLRVQRNSYCHLFLLSFCFFLIVEMMNVVIR